MSNHRAKFHADLDTPVSAYLKLSTLAPYSFLYESIEGPRQWARYSIIGVGADETFLYENNQLVTKVTPKRQNGPQPTEPLELIRKAYQDADFQEFDDAPSFVNGIFGFLSYDAVKHFETIGEREKTPSGWPEALFIKPSLIAVFDNHAHSLELFGSTAEIVSDAKNALKRPAVPPSEQRTWQPPTILPSRDNFMEQIKIAKEYIRNGDIIQAVLSRKFSLPPLAAPFNIYRGLRLINPSPYMFFFKTPDMNIAGASPEAMVRVANNKMIVRPIAGTRPRTYDAEKNQRLARELLADPKERAEHVMLVDLGRNDVGRVCVPGSVKVSEMMTIEHYSHVMHIVSEVQGTLPPKLDAFDALRASFPAGTLSGAPKIRAMQIIEELEPTRRGLYGGAVGYFTPDGQGDFGIAIRTVLSREDSLVIQAGAGSVADSVPELETDETEHKAKAVLKAIQWGSEVSD